MRILLTGIAHFSDLQGGSQRIVHDESIELRDRGHEVWVIAPGGPSLPEYELRDGVRLLRYVPRKVPAWNPARRLVHQRSAAPLLARYIPRIDALHGHTPLTYLAALDTYKDRIHTCFTVHSPARLEMAIVWKHAGLLRRLSAPAALAAINQIERECLRRSGIITALSRFTIDCIARIHGRELAARLRLLPGWVDTSRYIPVVDRSQVKRQWGWPTDCPVLFTLRRLAPRMGLTRLLDACNALRRHGIRFHLMIGGGGPMRMELERKAWSLGLRGVVTFMGRIDEHRLPEAYGACDAFILPTSELECFGLIAIEALAAGRPVLATPVGAIPEVLSRFEPAWLSSSGDAASIADLIQGFLAGDKPDHNPWQLHELAERAYGRATRLPAFVDSTVCAHSGC